MTLETDHRAQAQRVECSDPHRDSERGERRVPNELCGPGRLREEAGPCGMGAGRMRDGLGGWWQWRWIRGLWELHGDSAGAGFPGKMPKSERW